MSLFRQVIPAQQVLGIIGDSHDFTSWLKNEHPEVERDTLIDGYRFALMCCINSIIDGICDDTLLGFESDFLFERCLATSIPLSQISSNCEKSILLKNMKSAVKAVSRSKTFEDLDEAINQ